MESYRKWLKHKESIHNNLAWKIGEQPIVTAKLFVYFFII